MRRTLIILCGLCAFGLLSVGTVQANGNGCEEPPCGVAVGHGGDGGDASAVGVGIGVSNAYATAVSSANAFQAQGQHQGQSLSNFNANGALNKGNNTVVSTNVEAPDLEEQPATPASVYVDMCSSGASVSGPGYGATLGSGDTFCKKLALAAAYERAGENIVAQDILNEARRDLKRRTFLTRFFDWIPVVGGLL